jgi:hypothetical protein
MQTRSSGEAGEVPTSPFLPLLSYSLALVLMYCVGPAAVSLFLHVNNTKPIAYCLQITLKYTGLDVEDTLSKRVRREGTSVSRPVTDEWKYDGKTNHEVITFITKKFRQGTNIHLYPASPFWQSQYPKYLSRPLSIYINM